MRADANRIALRAIRTILSGATSVTLKVHGKDVECSLLQRVKLEWPKATGDLDAAADGPWPSDAEFSCKWDGGGCVIRLSAVLGSPGRYANNLLLRASLPYQSIIWINVSQAIGDKQDGEIAKPAAVISFTKRGNEELNSRMARAMSTIVAEAGLPLGTQSKMLPCDIEVHGGAVLPSGEVAARRLLHFALIKLDFISGGERAKTRGRPLLNIEDLVGAVPEFEDEEDDETEDAALFGAQAATAHPVDMPLNLILYGPPGTGKTYSLQQDYIPAFTRKPSEVRGIDAATDTVTDLGWLPVIALALHQLGGRAKVDQLLENDLVRAKYALNAPKSPLRGIVWGYLGQHTIEGSTTVYMKRRLGELLFDKEKDGTWKLAAALPDDVAEIATSLNRRKPATAVQDFVFTTFHQSFSYEDFVEGIKPRVVREGADEEASQLVYELSDGVFNRAARAALRLTGFAGTLDEFCRLPKAERTRLSQGARPYAVFIDEINRGNVSRIFGELITLLEEDKRLGAENEIIATLPYSRTLFGVPKNLHVIGTMNTADRSVDALDVALRRRFAFRELVPRPDLLSFPMEGLIDLAAMLQTINRRLEKLLDRDHCIGHAYFLKLKDDPTLARLTRIMEHAILPLLQEYFFGDWGKIGLVLGQEFVQPRDLKSTDLADFHHPDRETLNERIIYDVADLDSLTTLSYRRIYERVDP